MGAAHRRSFATTTPSPQRHLPTMSDDSGEGHAYILQTAGFDARFPNTNQTKHCWQNYVDYYRCINAKGEDFAPCKQFFRAYHSLCPNEWKARWDEQRENGTFPNEPRGVRCRSIRSWRSHGRVAIQ